MDPATHCRALLTLYQQLSAGDDRHAGSVDGGQAVTRGAAQPRSHGHPGYDLVHERAPQSGEEARRLVRVALAAWGRRRVDLDAAEVVVAELVANAVRHTAGPALRVIIDRPDAGRVYVAVVARVPRRLPAPRTPAPDETDGRGLLLVNAYALRCGYDILGGTRPWGKRVWVLLETRL
ncbi:ATP-binding protein [Streptomyces sp. NPDC002589]|uniref:ATP-binding protein n=1 Tax=Streptomyces sp. NPDC002589 TaxID=3154420 RepID=UPI00332F0C37